MTDGHLQVRHQSTLTLMATQHMRTLYSLHHHKGLSPKTIPCFTTAVLESIPEKHQLLLLYLEKCSTERFQQAFWQSRRCAVTEASCNEEGCLLLNGWVFVVHHCQHIFTYILQCGLQCWIKQSLVLSKVREKANQN